MLLPAEKTTLCTIITTAANSVTPVRGGVVIGDRVVVEEVDVVAAAVAELSAEVRS